MKYLLILIFAVLFASCATDRYIIKEKLISVPVPDKEDTLYVVSKTDTLIIAEHIHLTDTIAIIKYYPQKEKIYYKISYDTIYIPIKDTVVIEKKEILSTNNYTVYLLIGISLLLAFYILFKK